MSKRPGLLRWVLGGLITAAGMALPWLIGGDAWYAMPPLLAVAATVVAGVTGTLGTVVVAGLTVGNLIAIGSTVYGVASARRAAKKAERAARAAYNAGLQDRMATVMGGEAPWQIIYGEAWAGPVAVADILTSGDKDQFKHMVLIWAAHECEAITDFTLNGEPVGALNAEGWVTAGKWVKGNTRTDTLIVTFDAGGAAEVFVPGGASITGVRPWVTDEGDPGSHLTGAQVTLIPGMVQVLQVNEPFVGQWAGRTASVTYSVTVGTGLVRVRHHLGSPDQMADTALMADCPGRWTASDRLRGLCYSIVTYDLNEPEFQGGPLEARAKIRGKKLYDHRTGSTAWSANNVLVISDYLRAEHGKGALMTQLLSESFIAGANICDESQTVTLTRPDGSTQVVTGPRYTCNGVIRTDADPDSVLDELAQSMGGWMVRSGGLWSVQAGAFSAPVMTLGEADCLGPIETVQGEEGHEVFNGMRGQWWDPAQKVRTDYLPYQNAAFVAEDGGAIWAPLNLPFTNELWRCWQLARMLTERSRGETITFPAKRRALKLKPGQRVLVNNGQLGMAAAVFRVLKKEYKLGGPVMLTLQQDAAEVWDASDARTALPPTAEAQPDPWTVPPVQGLAAQSGNATLVRHADGTVLGRVRVSCTPSEDVYVLRGGALQVEYRLDDATSWQRAAEAGAEDAEAYLLGLEERRVYVVRARWRNAIGALGDWRSTTVMHLGKSEAPGNVLDLAAVAVVGGAAISWAPSPDADYAATVLRVGADWASGTEIFRGAASRFSWPQVTAGTYTILARHEDSSGNPSAGVASAEVTLTGAAADGYVLDVSLPVIVLPASSAGVVSSYAGAAVNVRVLQGAVDDTENWTLARTNGSGVSSTLSAGVLTVSLLTDGTEASHVDLSAERAGFVTLTRRVQLVKARAGAAISVEYSVDGATGWHATFTAGDLYMRQRVGDGAWSAAIRIVGEAGEPGEEGSPGTRVAEVKVYRWSATVPATPSGSSNYTWDSGALDSVPAGWATVPGAPVAGWTLYAAMVRLANSSNTATDVVNWAAASIVAQSRAGTDGAAGDDGAPGLQAATAYLYQWAAGAPSAPSGSSTYTWASGSHGSYTGGGGWSVTIPANPGTPGLKLWVATKAVTAAAGTASSSVAWTGATVAAYAANGEAGDQGPGGLQAASPTVYQWSPTIPAGPTGAASYTWSTGSFGAAPGGWSLTPGSSPSAGFTLWAAAVQVQDTAGTPSTAFNWASAGITARGYAGANGGAGPAGASARVAYARIAGNPSPAIGNVSTGGSASFPSSAQSNAVWGLNVSWGASDPSPSSTSSLYVTDGIYNPATGETVWATPYLASLKVGTLSAITVNTGALSVTGNLTMSGGLLLGGAFTGYSWPATGWGFCLGESGLLIGNYNNGRWVQITATGEVSMPGFSVSSGSASFSGNLSAAGGTFRGAVYGGAFTAAYAWAAGSGFHLSANGLLIGDQGAGRYIEINGSGNIYAPQFSIVNGLASFSGALNAASGIFQGSVRGGGILGWSWATATGPGFYLGPEGLLIGRNLTGSYDDTGAWVQLEANGNLYSAQFRIVGGVATFKGVVDNNSTFGSFSASVTGGDLTVSVANGAAGYGSRTASVSGGKAPYTYSWALSSVYGDVWIASGQNAATLSLSGRGSNTINNAQATCTVTDANGRAQTVTFTVIATHGTPF